ncbi:MAG TPA: helix-turn-helix domain-containing protein [Solirubrobacterales bacterium]|nr:helix-turn-helix domain-containing protein [Solirubrobacterales bacterium]
MPNEIVTPSSADRVAGMVRVAPDPTVADLVDQHWIVIWDRRGAAPVRREVLPDPCVNLTVEPAGRFVYGVGSGYGVRVLDGAGMVLGTKFRPAGFSGIWPGSMSELRGRTMGLPEVFGAAGDELDDALAAAPDIPGAIAAVTAFINARRQAPDPQRLLAVEIAEAMRGAGPGATVNGLAAEFAISPRTLQRLFARHVGAAPKQVLQRFRRQRAVDRLSDPGRSDLAWIAAELGYADQSHLTRDFRTTLGRCPAALARRS